VITENPTAGRSVAEGSSVRIGICNATASPIP
jgi:hypothetical protein